MCQNVVSSKPVKNSAKNLVARDTAMSGGWNAWSKTTLNNTEQSFKSGIPKNDRKIDITFEDFGP